MKNNRTKRVVQIAIILGFAAYNYIAMISIKSIDDRLLYIDNKVSLANFQSVKIPDLLASNNENVKYLEQLSKSFESDVDYLESLNEIKDKCKAYRITVSELTSELKNNLAAPQGAFEKYDRTVAVSYTHLTLPTILLV